MSTADKSAGRPPDLKYLPIAELVVDTTYQRTTTSARSRKLIDRIAAGFKWAHFQAIIATPLGKGKFAIVDGQHRVEAAKRRGLARVPAVVIDALGAAEAAEAFIAANRDRVAVNPLQIHVAALAARDPDALRVRRVCEAAGVRLLRYPVQAKQMKPGETMALGAIRRTIAEAGEDAAAAALRLVARAARAQGGTIRAAIIRAVAILRGQGGTPDGAIVKVLAAASPAGLQLAALERANAKGLAAGLAEEIAARAALVPWPDPKKELADALGRIKAAGLKIAEAPDGTYRIGRDPGYTALGVIEIGEGLAAAAGRAP